MQYDHDTDPVRSRSIRALDFPLFQVHLLPSYISYIYIIRDLRRQSMSGIFIRERHWRIPFPICAYVDRNESEYAKKKLREETFSFEFKLFIFSFGTFRAADVVICNCYLLSADCYYVITSTYPVREKKRNFQSNSMIPTNLCHVRVLFICRLRRKLFLTLF